MDEMDEVHNLKTEVERLTNELDVKIDNLTRDKSQLENQRLTLDESLRKAEQEISALKMEVQTEREKKVKLEKN